MVPTTKLQFLPAATKLGQGNIFTPVCDSVNGGGSASVHAGMHPPSRQNPTSRQADSPAGRPAPGRQTPPGTVNARLVRILLECILVPIEIGSGMVLPLLITNGNFKEFNKVYENLLTCITQTFRLIISFFSS